MVESSDGISNKLGVGGGASLGGTPCIAVLIRDCTCGTLRCLVQSHDNPWETICQMWSVHHALSHSLGVCFPFLMPKINTWVIYSWPLVPVGSGFWDNKSRVREKQANKDHLMMVMILILASSARISGRRSGALRKQPWRFLNTSTWWPWT